MENVGSKGGRSCFLTEKTLVRHNRSDMYYLGTED